MIKYLLSLFKKKQPVFNPCLEVQDSLEKFFRSNHKAKPVGFTETLCKIENSPIKIVRYKEIEVKYFFGLFKKIKKFPIIKIQYKPRYV